MDKLFPHLDRQQPEARPHWEAPKVNEQVKDKARKAGFDERLSLMGMLIDQIQQEIRENMQTSAMLQELMNPLKALKGKA